MRTPKIQESMSVRNIVQPALENTAHTHLLDTLDHTDRPDGMGGLENDPLVRPTYDWSPNGT